MKAAIHITSGTGVNSLGEPGPLVGLGCGGPLSNPGLDLSCGVPCSLGSPLSGVHPIVQFSMSSPNVSILDQLVSKAGHLYSLPAVAMRVLQLTDDPKIDTRALK